MSRFSPPSKQCASAATSLPGIRHDVTSIPAVASRRENLEIRNVNLAGTRDLVIDVALIHEFSGDCWRDLSRKRKPCYDDPDLLVNNVARVNEPSTGLCSPESKDSIAFCHLAFLSAILSTSGRIHGEFLRLLYAPSYRQTVKVF